MTSKKEEGLIDLARIPAGRDIVRVALNDYKGRRIVDLRTLMPLAQHTRDLWPTTMGVALDIEQLPELRRAVQEAEAVARDLGWLGEGGAEAS